MPSGTATTTASAQPLTMTLRLARMWTGRLPSRSRAMAALTTSEGDGRNSGGTTPPYESTVHTSAMAAMDSPTPLR